MGGVCYNEDNHNFIFCSARLRCCYRASFVGGRSSLCELFLAKCLYRKSLQVLFIEELLYMLPTNCSISHLIYFTDRLARSATCEKRYMLFLKHLLGSWFYFTLSYETTFTKRRDDFTYVSTK